MSTSESRRPLVDGRFELISRLGSGGMGTVWRARDIALDREVALKEVRPPDPAVEEATPGLAAQARERAVREAKALARLSNPHVVTIHHIVDPSDGTHPWIVMELVEGRSVYDRLTQGPMPVPEVTRLGLEVLSALRAAHRAGIQHRDVKPANVLLRPDGSAVLTDFGIAVLRESTSRLTSTGDLIGSPEYIAPERVRGEEGNPASDLWSLGMLLYVAAEGRHPLRRATSLATVMAVLEDPIPAPARSGALTPVLTRLLVRDPAERPDAARLEQLLRTARDTPPATAEQHDAASLHPYAAGNAPAPPPGTPAAGAPRTTTTPAAAVFGPPAPPPSAPGPPRRRGLALSLALAAALTAGGAGLVYAVLPGDGAHDRAQAQGPSASPAPDGKRSGGPASPAAASAGQGSPKAGQGSPEPDADGVTPRPKGSLLTPENARTVVEAFREASGVAEFRELIVYEGYAVASIPTKAGAKTYDRYEYRGGAARRTGPGGTIDPDEPDEQPLDPAAMDWDGLPALIERGERELNVENPTMRYVMVDRWTFNSDRPTLRFYLVNAYSAVGYLAAGADGKVVESYPAD
ncbi:serine/threonine-protein kinase [Streptomyces sp. PR69]|uniref:serine/threonine-protein kinase n=1 Tax=Streptomyces sp. PR69 TaxID=2984950 RepID=UPI002264B998|nr:serine/threonine-protein kinase [Streptomyces sp. PR69]